MIDAHTLELLLRSAGWTSLRMRSSGPSPALRVQQIDTVGDPNTEYGYTPETIRWSPPSNKEIALMDEVVSLLPLLEDRRMRRVIALRMLWNDDRQRHVNSYRRIGNIMRSSHGHIRDMYETGTDRLLAMVNQDTARLRRLDAYRSVYTNE